MGKSNVFLVTPYERSRMLQVKRNLNKFVMTQCANYHSGNECLMADYQPCLVLAGKRCGYFERAVLGPPNYPYPLPDWDYAKLFAQYAKATGAKTQKIRQRRCGCGSPLARRQRMCAKCRQIRRRQTNRKSQRLHRLDVSS